MRPQSKEIQSPTGKLRSSSLSIKKLMNPETEEISHQDLDNLPHEHYSMDDIKMAWHSYAFNAKENGKETFYSALKRRDPKLKEANHYVLEVDNQVQIDYIRPLLGDFMGYVRKRVKNYSVMISLELSDNPEEEITHLTGKDKFKKMAQKNPYLHSFKKVFNLDIDF